MKPLFNNVIVALGILFTLAACDSTPKTSRSQYEKLLDQYKKLSALSEQMSLNWNSEFSNLMRIDRQLLDLDYAIGSLQASAEAERMTQTEISNVTGQFREAFDAIVLAERSILVQVENFEKAVRDLGLEKGPQVQEALSYFLQLNSQLLGLRNTLARQLKLLVIAHNFPNDVNPFEEKKIELTEEEQIVADIESTGGVARDRSGNTVVLNNREQVMDYASQHGFNTQAASSGYQMSSRTGGIVGYSNDATEISKTVSQMVQHMKGKMNQNEDDLELVFLIDYSGSMGDDIDGVIAGLIEITDSLAAIKRSGRRVKVGIATFGEPGKESVDLAFTENLVSVKSALQSLLRNYPSNQHSTDPGEAWYHGLKEITSGFRWSSQNRSVVAITDEPSYEIQMGHTNYIEDVEQGLKSQGINVRIYSLITR